MADRIIALQKQLSIARRALEKLRYSHDHSGIAAAALDDMNAVSMGKSHAADTMAAKSTRRQA